MSCREDDSSVSGSDESDLAQNRQAVLLLRNIYKGLLRRDEEARRKQQLVDLFSDNQEDNDDLDDSAANVSSEGIQKRAPVVLPRIGAEKRAAILKPRIGRAMFQPRIGRSQSNFNDAAKRAIFQPRVGK